MEMETIMIPNRCLVFLIGVYRAKAVGMCQYYFINSLHVSVLIHQKPAEIRRSGFDLRMQGPWYMHRYSLRQTHSTA
jgi:hypothetical protein